MPDKIKKTDAQWRAQLTDEQYCVTRLKVTERPFSGIYNEHNEEGTYVCACCDQPLFKSDTKFDSRTGWPSFWAPVDEEVITMEEDRSLMMVRTEVACSRCDAHLGHVFLDGPDPTGQRYCMNSASLRLKPKISQERDD